MDGDERGSYIALQTAFEYYEKEPEKAHISRIWLNGHGKNVDPVKAKRLIELMLDLYEERDSINIPHETSKRTKRA